MRLLLFCFLLTFSTSSLAKPLVVTTFSIIEDMVHTIAQDKVDVKSLVGPDQDPHVFEPRPQHAKELSTADLVVENGLGFEGWLERLIEASGFKGKIIIATTGINPLSRISHGKTIPDPHAWHSLQNAQIYVDNIVAGLSELLPRDASFFKAQGDAYKRELAVLEAKTAQALEAIPVEKRKVITNHDAFGYLGREFNITFFSPLGISTDAEPSAKTVVALIHRIRTEGITAIFAENISNPRLLEQITKETGTRIGGTLYSDALSAPGSNADTYLKMMSFNLSSLVNTLGKK
ncbi:MAG: zinc ABC transporter substrate-binding protein [Proteobacteria bacterium]|nr:zinc ABC transporter substrate-binding protein [Pseudomonadota bacterium]